MLFACLALNEWRQANWAERREIAMATWYYVSSTSFLVGVESVEVGSETAKFVVVNGLRRAKESPTDAYRPTRVECWQWLASKRKRAVDSLELQLQVAQEELDNAKRAAAKDLGEEVDL